jgi:flavodoxin
MAIEIGADIIKTEEANPDILAGYDLIGFSSGIYNGQHEKCIFDLVARMHPKMGQKAFTFSTSGYGVTKPNEKLNKELKAKGFDLVGTFACKGFDTYGVNKLYGGAAKGHPDEEVCDWLKLSLKILSRELSLRSNCRKRYNRLPSENVDGISSVCPSTLHNKIYFQKPHLSP